MGISTNFLGVKFGEIRELYQILKSGDRSSGYSKHFAPGLSPGRGKLSDMTNRCATLGKVNTFFKKPRRGARGFLKAFPFYLSVQSLEFLFWLLTLNSVVNPWIYLAFNNNLVESLKRLFCPSRQEDHRRRGLPKRSRKGLFQGQQERKSRSVSPALTQRFVALDL